MAEYQHIACKDCPCWRQFYTDGWNSPVYVEKIKDDKPLIDSEGNPVILRGQGGEKLIWGACCAKLPEFGTNNQVHVMMRSDWWCESEEKYRAIERHRRKQREESDDISFQFDGRDLTVNPPGTGVVFRPMGTEQPRTPGLVQEPKDPGHQ